MKKLLLPTLAMLPLFAMAQGAFTVTGTGAAFKKGDKIYLVYRVDDEVKTDSVTAGNNTFQFKGAIAGIARASLYKNEDPLTAAVVYDYATIYLEAGDIHVTSADSLKHATISGTQNNADLVELNNILMPLNKQLWKLNTDFDALTAAQQQDINRVSSFRANVKAVKAQMQPLQFAFIKAHPNSYISLVTIQELQRNTEIAIPVEEAYNTLTATVRETPLGIVVGGAIKASVRSAIGNMAINFTQPGVNGTPVQLTDFKGKYVLLDFWASWCSPCRAENPFIVAAYNKYKNKGFTIIGVSLDDSSTKAAWIKAIQTDGLAWTHVSDLKGWQNEVAALYGIKLIPANVLIDASGKIIAKNIKDKTLDDMLAALLNGDGK